MKLVITGAPGMVAWKREKETNTGQEGEDVAERDELQARIAEAARPLTDRQRAFVLEYLRDLNGTQAAIRAGYAGDRAASTASRLLRKPEIRAFRDVLLEERFEAVGINRHNIVLCVWQQYLRCCQKEPVMEWDSGAHDWVPTGEWTYNSKGALKALEMLWRMLPEVGGGKDDSAPAGLEALLLGGGEMGGREC